MYAKIESRLVWSSHKIRLLKGLTFDKVYILYLKIVIMCEPCVVPLIKAIKKTQE